MPVALGGRGKERREKECPCPQPLSAALRWVAGAAVQIGSPRESRKETVAAAAGDVMTGLPAGA